MGGWKGCERNLIFAALPVPVIHGARKSVGWGERSDAHPNHFHTWNTFAMLL